MFLLLVFLSCRIPSSKKILFEGALHKKNRDMQLIGWKDVPDSFQTHLTSTTTHYLVALSKVLQPLEGTGASGQECYLGLSTNDVNGVHPLLQYHKLHLSNLKAGINKNQF